MKFKYPITVIAISILAIASMILYGTLTKAEYNETVSFIATLFLIIIKISIYWIIAIVIWKICQKIRQASLRSVKAQMHQQKAKKMKEIEQELDEIEASLDAVSSNDKVTPIWGGQPKKKP